ncbi:hypothetical protein FS837_009241 [Tulasnella sp. UAMH 9824]|nr:hypothetical protein FS837_009241 [Tulasnella sp. UAMH 9824]
MEPVFLLRHVSVIHDQDTGWSWLVAEGKNVSVLKSRLRSRPLKGYTTREVQQQDGEKERLQQKLEAEITSRKRASSSPQARERTRSSVSPLAESCPRPLGTNSSELLDGFEESIGAASSSPSTAIAEGSTPSTSIVLGTSTSTVLGTSDAHVIKTALLNLSPPPHKKQRTEGLVVSPPLIDESHPFNELPFEIIAAIMRSCFDGLETPAARLHMLRTLYWVGRTLQRVLSELPSLWTTIHPAAPPLFITTAINHSKSFPLSIEYVPRPVRSGGWQTLERFFRQVEGTRDRWETVNLAVYPNSLASLTQALESPAPLLRSLRISVVGAGWLNDSQRLAERVIWAQADQPFRLLGGDQGNLRHLELQNVPCLFDPTPFTLLTSLSLAAGVRLKFQDVLDFLTKSTQLEEFRLVDAKLIDVTPHELAERLVLPHLKRLVLVDRAETSGITTLYHSIKANNCENLNLEVRGVQEMWDPRLVESIAPVVRKAFEAETRSTLRFSRYKRFDATAWEGTSATHGFRVGLIGDAFAQVVALSDFINRVLPLAGGATEVNLEVEDMFSGTVRGCIAFDDAEAIPRLLPHLLNNLTVTEIVAEVVDGYLRHLRDFVAPDLRKGLPALRRITLRAIPKDEVPSPPEPAVGCALEDFIDSVSHAYYGVAPGNPIPVGKRKSITVVLDGRFGADASTMKALASGRDGERTGVRIVTARATLHCINRLM